VANMSQPFVRVSCSLFRVYYQGNACVGLCNCCESPRPPKNVDLERHQHTAMSVYSAGGIFFSFFFLKEHQCS